MDGTELVHAYGEAEDIPGLLRAMESEDPDVREAAVEWLCSASWREDSFFTATARTVPELARLALELPGHRADLLDLLGDLAHRAQWSEEDAPARQAVAEELPSLLHFAHDADTDVRSAVVVLIAACGQEYALPHVPLLWARFAEETDPLVRGRVVTALALLETGDGGWRRDLLTDAEPRVALAAAEDLLRTAELPLPDALVDHGVRAYAADPHEPERALWPAPHKVFTDRLLEDPEAALRATAGGVPLAFEIVDTWRDREADVLPWALRTMTGEDWELSRLAQLTCSLPAERHEPVRAHVRPYLTADDPAVRAAAISALARAHAPEAVEEAVRLVEELPGPYVTFRAATAVAEEFGAEALPVARAVARRLDQGSYYLLEVLKLYPEVALEVIEELTELLARTGTGYPPVAVAVLHELGPAAGDLAERALLACVTERAHSSVSAVAAVALHRISGDPGPALSFFREELSAGFSGVTDWASQLGPAAEPLLPFIEPLLAGGSEVAATAVWRITGRTEDTLEPLARGALRCERLYGSLPHPLTTLTEMGLVPRFAVDPLRQAAESPTRVLKDLMCGEALHPDYVLRNAVRKLLETARVVE